MKRFGDLNLNLSFGTWWQVLTVKEGWLLNYFELLCVLRNYIFWNLFLLIFFLKIQWFPFEPKVQIQFFFPHFTFSANKGGSFTVLLAVSQEPLLGAHCLRVPARFSLPLPSIKQLMSSRVGARVQIRQSGCASCPDKLFSSARIVRAAAPLCVVM